MAKEDATGQAVEPSMEQLLDINRKQSEIISAQARTIEELRGTIVELNASLAWLKRKVFGKMSEKCKPVDNGDPKLPFDYGDLEQIEAEIEDARSRAAEQITVPKSRAANKTPRRNRVVMDNLPVVTVVIEPENVDLSRYVKIGEEHTRTLEMKPGYLYVKDTVRPTYALKNEMEAVDNGEKAVITAPMPLMPIYKGMPGASMLAEVLTEIRISCPVLPTSETAGTSGCETVQKHIGRLVQTGLRASQATLSGTQEESTGRRLLPG